MEFKVVDIFTSTLGKFDRWDRYTDTQEEAEESLAERVNVFMEDGWRRDGPVQILEYSHDNIHFVQMMVRGHER